MSTVDRATTPVTVTVRRGTENRGNRLEDGWRVVSEWPEPAAWRGVYRWPHVWRATRDEAVRDAPRVVAQLCSSGWADVRRGDDEQEA